MDTNLESRILICSACNEEFVFTVEAQEYFLEKGYAEDPQMCKSCYLSNKRDKRNSSNGTNKAHGSASAVNGANANGNRKNGARRA